MQIPAYVIHLESQTARKEKIEKRLATIPEFRPIFINGVNGASIPEIDRIKTISPHYFAHSRLLEMTPGEWGCATSHLNCCKEFLNGSENVCAVLEDDVLLSDTISSAISASLSWVDVKQPRILLLSTNVFVWRFGKCRQGDFSIYKLLQGNGAYGFLMNKSAAAIRLAKEIPFISPCDWWIQSIRRGIDVRVLSPHQANYLESREDSTIEPQRKIIVNQSKNSKPTWPDSFSAFLHFDLFMIFVKAVVRTGLAFRLVKTW